jgi:hypothetical protein
MQHATVMIALHPASLKFLLALTTIAPEINTSTFVLQWYWVSSAEHVDK